MWDKGVSYHFQNLYGIHQHLFKRVRVISPSCSFKSGDLGVFPGCLFCSVPCKFWDKPLQRITIFCQQIASLLNRIRSLLIHNCSVLSLWWFKAQSRGCESRTPSGNASMGQGERQIQLLYTGITLEKENNFQVEWSYTVPSLCRTSIRTEWDEIGSYPWVEASLKLDNWKEQLRKVKEKNIPVALPVLAGC